MPAALDRTGPEAAIVLAAVGGGHILDQSPRFVLARWQTRTLIGIACTARRISADMNSDGRRPLFCFVGWFSGDTKAAAIPPLIYMEATWTQWAAMEYERWMRAAWNTHPSMLRMPTRTTPGAPAWGLPSSWLSGASAGHSSGSLVLPPATGQIRVHPPTARAEVWRAVASHRGDATLITGWRAYRDGIQKGITDICADDVSGNQPFLVPAPTPNAPAHSGRVHRAPTYPPTPTEPERTSHEEVTSPTGRWTFNLRNVAPHAFQSLKELVWRGDAERDRPRSQPPPPASPPLPPPGPPGSWSDNPRKGNFFSEIDGITYCWNGRELFRWDGAQWVEEATVPCSEDDVTIEADRWVNQAPAKEHRTHSQAPATDKIDFLPKQVAPEPLGSETVTTEMVTQHDKPPPLVVPPLPSANEISRRFGKAFDDFEKSPLPADPARKNADDHTDSSADVHSRSHDHNQIESPNDDQYESPEESPEKPEDS